MTNEEYIVRPPQKRMSILKEQIKIFSIFFYDVCIINQHHNLKLFLYIQGIPIQIYRPFDALFTIKLRKTVNDDEISYSTNTDNVSSDKHIG